MGGGCLDKIGDEMGYAVWVSGKGRVSMGRGEGDGGVESWRGWRVGKTKGWVMRGWARVGFGEERVFFFF